MIYPTCETNFERGADAAIGAPVLVSPEEWSRDGVIGDVVGVDFETYYTSVFSVASMGIWAYCQDPRFDAYLVAVADSVKVCVCRPEEFPWETISGLEWVSHNREFDRMVWERLVAEGDVGIPGQDGPPPWRAWHCSAAVCAFLQFSRDLAGAVEEVFGVRLDKSVRAKARGRSEGRGQRSGQKELNFGDAAFDEEMLLYAARDAVACLALWMRLGEKWPERERRLFDLTCEMGRRGLAMDWSYVEASRLELNRKVGGLKASLPWVPSLSIPKFKAACEAVGVPAPKSTAVDEPDFLAWAEEYRDTPAGEWARTLQAVRSGNRTAKVLESMEGRRCLPARRCRVGMERGSGQDVRVPGGRMIYELKYCGANTGRWSGGGGLNLQNLNRSEAEGVDLRRAIVAPKDHVLGVVDFAQIESRVLLFLAGDHATLTLLREHPEMDVYEVHARATMGFGAAETLKAYCARTGSGLRQLAKARVLGLGFGCGKDKFVSVAKSMAGLDISLAESDRIVREYRESNPLVVGLWRRLEDACRSKVGGDYVLPLPCTQRDRGYGRYLIYRDVRLEGRELRCRVGGQDTGIYGGLLAENFTQAAARDVLAEAWIRCAEAGYVPVLSVHDELVFELPEESAEADLAQIVDLMETPVPWAPALPLKAEGSLMKFYQK